MFVSPAYAQFAGDGGSSLVSLLPLVLIFVVFYFLLIRPQQKKMKAHRMLVEAVRRGDRELQRSSGGPCRQCVSRIAARVGPGSGGAVAIRGWTGIVRPITAGVVRKLS